MSDIVERLRKDKWHVSGVDCETAAQEIERLRKEVAGLRETLANTRQAIERANTTPNGPICDTIWYDNHETLFDYMDAAIDAMKGKP